MPQHATEWLAGRSVREVVARGKHLLTRIDDGRTLHTHLGMDGSWRVVPRTGSRRRGGPAFEIRVLLENAEWVALGFRLPVVDLLRTADEDRVVGHLGPDLLGSDWDAAEAVHRLSADPAREIGLALLDQRNLAGLGNVYQIELCFLRGITPWTPVEEAGDLRRLVDLAHQVLRLNRDHADMVTTGDRRPGRRRWVYQQDSCGRCGGRVSRGPLGIGESARLVYWCPRCQRGPAPRAT